MNIKKIRLISIILVLLLTLQSFKISLAAYEAKDTTSSLSAISVNGVALENFDSQTLTYSVELPYGTTEIPEVSATPTSIEATVNITQAAVVTGSATITVTAEDGTTTTTYTVNFSEAALFGGSSGTIEDPYQISTPAELNQVRNYLEAGKYFILKNDIDLNVAPYNIGTGWVPIGYYDANNTNNTSMFNGYFDGRGHVIKNLMINNPNAISAQGLFAYPSDFSTIINLGLENVNVLGKDNTGGLAGYNDGKIINCYTTGVVLSTGIQVGGLVGHHRFGQIKSSYSSATVTGTQYVGGLVGRNRGPIENSYTRGNVNGGTYAGGFVGYHHRKASINNCYSTGAVAGTSIGSFIGLYESPATITNAYVDGQSSGGITTGAINVSSYTSIQMKNVQNYATNYAGFDFDQYWAIDASKNDGYPFTVWPIDTTAPSLTLGSAIRTSDSVGTVKFTSNEAGSYYYAVVTSGAIKPNISTAVAGTICTTSETAISLSDLTAGAKDVYIVVKDAEWNVSSNSFKINLDAYEAPDNTPPILTSGEAIRTSDTAGTVKFTSNEAGSYYYAAVPSGSTKPNINTIGTGTACTTSETSISLSGMSAGAKDVYIVVKDAAGNLSSNSFKISLDAYVAQSPTKLTTPSGLSWDVTTPSVAKWDAVVTASSYTVQLIKGDSPYGSPVTGITGTSYDLIPTISAVGTGTYKFSVQAIGDGENYSDSDTATVANSYSYTSSNNALYFDDDAYVTSITGITPDNYTVEFKIYLDETKSTWQGIYWEFSGPERGIYVNQDFNIEYWWGYYINNGPTGYEDSENYSYFKSKASLKNKAWNHVAITYDKIKKEFKIYINGVLDITKTLESSDAALPTTNVRMGAKQINNYHLGDGALDEFRIWDVVRSAKEISDNKDSSLSTPYSENLVRYYDFNQGISKGTNTSATKLIDRTGKSDDATLENFALTGSTSNWVSVSSLVDFHTHCVCGSELAVGDHTTHSAITFTPLNTTGGALTTGNYYLTGDVTLTSGITIGSGQTVNLCLNGYKLDANGGSFSTITIIGGTLNLSDCKAGTGAEHFYYYNEASGKFVLADTKPINYDSLTVSKGSFKGGAITGATTNSGITAYGTLNFYSGAVVANNSNSYGGGINITQNSQVSIYSGRILGNSAAPGGGLSIMQNGNVIMYGGEISDNISKSSGGGVYLSHSGNGKSLTFSMMGGKITRNISSSYGGGVFAATNIYTTSNVTFNLSGGEITDNVSSKYDNGGGIYIGIDGNGTTNQTGKTNFNLSGNPKIINNKKGTKTNNLYLAGEKTINITGEMTNSEPIGVLTDISRIFTSGAAITNSTLLSKFTSDKSVREVVTEGNQLKTIPHIFVGGVKVDSTSTTLWRNDGNGSLTSTGATSSNYNVKFEPASGENIAKLTLNSANISKVQAHNDDYKYGIYSEVKLVLSLLGENTINTSQAAIDYSNIGIYNSDELLISGTGNLNVTAAKAEYSYGIWGKDLEISNTGKIDITSGEAIYESVGILLNNDMTIDNGSVSTFGSDLTNEDYASYYNYTYGLYAYGDIKLNGGSIELGAGTAPEESNIKALNSAPTFGGIYANGGYKVLAGSSKTSALSILSPDSNTYTNKYIKIYAPSNDKPSVVETNDDNDYTPPTPVGNIIVNGKTEAVATSISKDANDKTTTKITVDDKKVEEKLQNEGKNSIVTIAVNNSTDVVVGQLNGLTVKNMETKEAIVEIKTEKATYTVPASQINIDAVSQQIGQQVKLEDIKVNISIAQTTKDVEKIVEDTAKKNNYQIVVKPVDFEISCSYGQKTVEVSQFNSYVERMIAVPEGVDPSKITTGIVLNSDGNFSHVPTAITVIDGKYFAKINSLTNSTYSVIWNPIKFTDVASHWAKSSVNDMGSRMVISGVGNGMFEPDRDITRAEFAAIVVRALGLKMGMGTNPFDDVKSSEWYSDYIKTATDYKLISGYGDGKFGPEDNITREQAMTIIARAMNITKLETQLDTTDIDNLLSSFDDFKDTSLYAKQSIAANIKAGIVSGKNSKTLAPKDLITRAEVAVIIQRLLQKSNLINF